MKEIRREQAGSAQHWPNPPQKNPLIRDGEENNMVGGKI
ncbi:MAG: hypothetical protein DDT19_02996 [Syntrophomonadaceae bacterium]|nr:hypothetical protein [Bacillota bacterium]